MVRRYIAVEMPSNMVLKKMKPNVSSSCLLTNLILFQNQALDTLPRDDMGSCHHPHIASKDAI